MATKQINMLSNQNQMTIQVCDQMYFIVLLQTQGSYPVAANIMDGIKLDPVDLQLVLVVFWHRSGSTEIVPRFGYAKAVKEFLLSCSEHSNF